MQSRLIRIAKNCDGKTNLEVAVASPFSSGPEAFLSPIREGLYFEIVENRHFGHWHCVQGKETSA